MSLGKTNTLSTLSPILILFLIVKAALCGNYDPHAKYNGDPNAQVDCDGDDDDCNDDGSASSECSDEDSGAQGNQGGQGAQEGQGVCLLHCYCTDIYNSKCGITLYPQGAPPPQQPPPAPEQSPQQPPQQPQPPQPPSHSHSGAAVAVGAAAAAGAAIAANSQSKKKQLSYPRDEQPMQPPQPSTQGKTSKCNWCIRENCNPGACQEVPNFNAYNDAKALHEAMKGLGTEEDVLIEILINRSEEQLEMIRQEYQGFGRGLDSDVAGDTSMKLKALFMALLKPRPDFYADELKHAFEKDDTDAMIMILTSLSPCAIREIGSAYSSKNNNRPLVDAAKSATNRKFEEFVVEIIKSNRDRDGPVDHAKAQEDAKALIDAGAGSWFKKDKRVFINIFTQRSFSHLKQVKEEYNKMLPNPGFDKDLMKQSGGGKLAQGLTMMMRNIEDQPGYFADELEGSVKKLVGMGIQDNRALIRILRGRCGIDLGDIREAYPKNHDNKPLVQMLQESSIGDYKKALVKICTQQDV